MKITLCIMLLVAITLGCIVTVISESVFCHEISSSFPALLCYIGRDTTEKYATPVFDGNDGTTSQLKLISCYSTEYYVKDQRESISEGFKSKKWACTGESWNGPRGIVYIRRWVFDFPGDALIMPEHALSSMLGRDSYNKKFPGWSKGMGERYFWIEKSLIFVKGRIVVAVGVNSTILGKDYVEKIARIMERKL